LVPVTRSVQVPGQSIDPSSQALTADPTIAIWPVLVAGAQISSFQQDRSPAGHQADPGQLAASAAEGALEHGEANQVRLFGESAPTLGGHGAREHGADPSWQPAAHATPDPAGKIVADEVILPA